ncbi:MAG: porphobilinogen synthase [Candidatus Omnitrophica bacterium]|nr:porphobilinogen synthase [Candidatus Omnitrophota bacterium]
MVDKIDLNRLIYPLFVISGEGVREAISSMPGIYRFSPDILVEEVDRLQSFGITKVLLFGVTKEKDEFGQSAHEEGNIIASAVKLLKKQFPHIIIMTDVCLCAYTSHGHCGVLKTNAASIDKIATLSALAKMAVSHASAGADYVAPSAMTQGQVLAIRQVLDKNGYKDTKIMGYSVKFASQFYGPFREAANSAPQFGDRREYQIDCLDRDRASKEVKDDISEGADIVMIKPALAYLDIIREIRDSFAHTLAAYNVSGEYAMVKAGAQAGYWDEKKIVFEIINSIHRAGADLIITYHARDIARWMKEKTNNEKTQLHKKHYAV